MKKSELRAFWIGLIGTALLSFILYRFLRSRKEIAPGPLLVTRLERPQPPIAIIPGREKDSLTAIRGIGPVTEQKLNAAGIRTYSQLAEASPSELEAFVAGHWDPADWITKARELSQRQES